MAGKRKAFSLRIDSIIGDIRISAKILREEVKSMTKPTTDVLSCDKAHTAVNTCQRTIVHSSRERVGQ